MMTEEQAVEKDLAERGLLTVARDIANAEGVPLRELLGRSRLFGAANARRRLYAELRRRGLSFPEIGVILRRNHSTVLAGLRATKTKPAPEPLRYRVAV